MITDYLKYLSDIKGYSNNTVTAYGKDLAFFCRWARVNLEDARWSMITRDDIDAFVASMVASGLKPSTTNRRLAALSGLYRFFRRQGLTVENPCRFESRRKREKTLPNTIPADDIKRAYDAAHGVAKVMLGLLATTGIRIQELLDLTWEDIDFGNLSIRIHGKGGKQRIVYTTEDKLEVLRNVASMGCQSGRIFTLDQRSARYIIWEALKPYSTARQLSPHAIRHSVATNMANKGANVTTIATILGHQDIRTTQKYIDMTQGNSRKAYYQYNLFN